jgi:hypothetical protein
MDACTQHFGNIDEHLPPSKVRLHSIMPSARAVDAEWLPTLGRWLHGLWAEVPIAERAVKADNACVDVHPWHQRISLVIACTPTSPSGITMFAMRRWRRNIVRSFFAYLGLRYGQEWLCHLSGKRLAALVTDGPLLSPAPKRRRTHVRSPSQRSPGGVVVSQLNLSGQA